MFRKLRKKVDRILHKLRLKPLSLAEKCRLQFGAAVLFSLVLALFVLYSWISKLTEKIALDSGRAVTDTIFEKHFQIEEAGQEKGLPKLDESGGIRRPDDRAVQWIRFEQSKDIKARLSEDVKDKVDLLLSDDNIYDYSWIDNTSGFARNNYVRLIRATDQCLTCHNAQGTAAPFNKNENVGILVVQTPAREIARTILMNRFWTVMAGLLAGTGAMIAFYTIAQRVILRPIRQLRAIANNVAEGNFEARSAIKSGDEYESLADAFNHMLDVLQEAQEKLRQANQQLDAKIAQLSDRNIELFKANKIKSEFLANMSHEFRTPLNAILGFAELLREKSKRSEKTKRYAENIMTSGRNLLNMINDLLDLAKAEAGKMELHVGPTDIRELCEGLVAFFSPLTEQRTIKLRFKMNGEIPVIHTDQGKVQQILYNLLSNAIKFTPEKGKVEIAANMFDDNTVRISISDTGPGISKEDQEKIFEKFRQIDGSITRKVAGTGLGLAISRELAELLAGSISLESKIGSGSVFHLDIPVNLPMEDIIETDNRA